LIVPNREVPNRKPAETIVLGQKAEGRKQKAEGRKQKAEREGN
jgi:hypothetical protein